MLFDDSSCFNTCVVVVKNRLIKVLIAPAVTLIFLLSMSYAQSDGLFDFQMVMAKKGNNPEAEYKVGEMYETGFGVKQDLNQAMVWIKKAAKQGHEAAGFKLLYWDIERNGLSEKNKPKFSELKNKAKAKNPHAMYYIGKMYAYGVGLNKNHKKSLNWLDKATFVGVLEAEREAIIVRDLRNRSPVKKSKAKVSSTSSPEKKPAPLTKAEKKKLKAKKQAERLKAYSLLLKKEAEADQQESNQAQ